MTRIDLFAYLLMKRQSQATHQLVDVFGDEWIIPMRDLVDLKIVTPYENRDGDTIYQVVGWKGKGITPDHNRPTRETAGC